MLLLQALLGITVDETDVEAEMLLLQNSILRDHDVVNDDDRGSFADDEASDDDDDDTDVRDPDGPTYVDEDVDASFADVADDIDNSAAASLSDGSVPMIDEAALETVLGCKLDEYNMTEEENLLVRSVVLYDRLPLDRDDDGVENDDGVTTTLDSYEAFITDIEAAHCCEVADEAAGGDAAAVVLGADATAITPFMSASSAKTLMTRMLAWRRHKRKQEARAVASLTIKQIGNKKHGNKNRRSVLDIYPHIGDEIEAIMKEDDSVGVGASAHRDTGIAIMNTNRKMAKGTGWERIRLELRQRNIRVSTSSIRRLCVARKQRTHAAVRHKNLVAVKCRRSVKRLGRFNLDSHYRNAFYRTVHHIRDRCSTTATTLIERDDKSKYRMNSGDTTCNIATVSDLEHQASPLKNVVSTRGTSFELACIGTDAR